jgi:hypothetical protein
MGRLVVGGGSNAFPRWVDWMPFFAAITRFAETLALPGIDEKPEGFQAIKLREALDEAMPALVRAGVSHELRSSRDLRGADLIQSLLADLDSLLGKFTSQTGLAMSFESGIHLPNS